MNTVIYYFTGSGNSLKIAKDLSEKLDNLTIIRITKMLVDSGPIKITGKTGVIFPVYVSGLPLIVEDFVNSLKIADDAYLFAIANFGESAGVSLVQLDDLLREKGKGLSAAFEILMPDNTQIMFPPGTLEEQEQCLKAQKDMMPEIASIISNGIKLTDKIDAVRKSGQARPHAFQPWKMAKKFFSDSECDSCGICVKVCPVNNITLSNGKPFWNDHCEMCLACMQWCPKEAIQFSEKTKEWGRYQNPYIDIKEMFLSK